MSIVPGLYDIELIFETLNGGGVSTIGGGAPFNIDGSLNVGLTTSAVDTGDFAASDGTNSMTYDASVGSLQVLLGAGGVNGAMHFGVAGVQPLKFNGPSFVEGPTQTIIEGINLDAFGINIGGWMGLGGRHTAGGVTNFGFIGGIKANATDGNNAGHLAFATRPNASVPVTRWRMTDAGHFIGETDNTYDFGASGATRPRSGYFGTALNVGNGITPSTDNGDIVAGDGTRSMAWDASAGNLQLINGGDSTSINPGGGVPLFVVKEVSGVAIANMVTWRLANSAGAGVAGMVNRLQWQGETTASGFTTMGILDISWRDSPVLGSNNAQMDFLLPRGGFATTQLTIGNSVTASGATRVEIPSGLMVGAPSSTVIAPGDIFAGTPTSNAMVWDQSAGTLVIGDPSAIPFVSINAVGAVGIQRLGVPGAVVGTLSLANCGGGPGTAGSGTGMALIAPNSAGECNTVSTVNAVLRQATNGDTYADYVVSLALAQATTELVEAFRVGNSQSAAGIHRIEVPGGGLMAGTIASITAAEAGDIVAGDGTMELFWDTSTGLLSLTGAGAGLTTDGSVIIGGDLTVNGTTTTVNSEIQTADNYILLNSEYTAAAAQASGLILNIDPFATSFGINDIVDGTGGSVITVTSGDPSASLSVGNFILIENPATAGNAGIFEVSAVNSTTITIEVSPAEAFSGTSLTDDATVQGTVVGVELAVWESSADGTFQRAFGSTAPLTRDVKLGAGFVNIGGSTTSATSAGDFAAGDGTRSLVWDASANALAIGDSTNALTWATTQLQVSVDSSTSAILTTNTDSLGFNGIVSGLRAQYLPSGRAGLAGDGIAYYMDLKDSTSVTRIGAGVLQTRWLNATAGALDVEISLEGYVANTSLKKMLVLSGGDLTINDTDGMAGIGVNRTWRTSDGWMAVGRSASIAGLADGDIVAGDGTREMSWDASVGKFTISGLDGVDPRPIVLTGAADGPIIHEFENTSSHADARVEYRLVGDNSIAQILQRSSTHAVWPDQFGIQTTNGGIRIATISTDSIILGTSNLSRWTVEAAGHITSVLDNTYDVGASGATRPRRVYVGTEVVIGDTITIDTDSIQASGDLAIDADGTGGVLNLGTGTTKEINIGTASVGLDVPGWLNVGGATAAVATGDLAAGDGTRELNWDASANHLSAGAGNNLLDWSGNRLLIRSEFATTTTTFFNADLARYNSTGSSAVGMGVGIRFRMEDNAPAIESTGTIETVWADVTLGAENTNMLLRAFDQTGGDPSTHLLTVATLRGVDASMRIEGGLEVGTSAGSITGPGDIIAGDGTNTWYYDASTGRHHAIVVEAANTTTNILTFTRKHATPASAAAGLGLSFSLSGHRTDDTLSSMLQLEASWENTPVAGTENAQIKFIQKRRSGGFVNPASFLLGDSSAGTDLRAEFRADDGEGTAATIRALINMTDGYMAVGDVASTTAAALGDFSAGDGTHELFWDTSSRTLNINSTSDATLYANGNNLNIRSTHDLYFLAGDTNRWQITSDGHLLASDDNNHDIGSEPGTNAGNNRPRRVYVGTEVVIGDTITIGTDSIDANGALSITSGWVDPTSGDGSTSAVTITSGDAAGSSGDDGSDVTIGTGAGDGGGTPGDIYLTYAGAARFKFSDDSWLRGYDGGGTASINERFRVQCETGEMRLGRNNVTGGEGDIACGNNNFAGGTQTGIFCFDASAAEAEIRNDNDQSIIQLDAANEEIVLLSATGSTPRAGALQVISGTSLLLKAEDAANRTGTDSVLPFTIRGGDSAADVVGGSLTLRGGNAIGAGASGGITLISGANSGTGDSGDVSIDVGTIASPTSGTEGTITIGGTSASAIAIGRSGITTDFLSGSTVDFTGVTVTGLTPSTTPQQETLTAENISGSDTALGDTLAATPTSNASVMLFHEGVFQEQGVGKDYTISGSTITWLQSTGTALPMTDTDTLVAVYSS